jgi:L,D-transpeptidase ErfK/SrfK
LIHGTNKPAGVGLRSSHGCIRLYPEDIESFYDMIPVGTQVRVVNQPFLFGWLDGELYMQASGPLEDDSHDGKQAQPDGLPKAQQTRIEKQLKHHDETLNVELVTALAHDPRGIPVAVSRADASLDEVLAARPKCRTACPKAPPGTASRICRPMRRASVKCSPIGIRRKRRCSRPQPARAACEDGYVEEHNG